MCEERKIFRARAATAAETKVHRAARLGKCLRGRLVALSLCFHFLPRALHSATTTTTTTTRETFSSLSCTRRSQICVPPRSADGEFKFLRAGRLLFECAAEGLPGPCISRPSSPLLRPRERCAVYRAVSSGIFTAGFCLSHSVCTCARVQVGISGNWPVTERWDLRWKIFEGRNFELNFASEWRGQTRLGST